MHTSERERKETQTNPLCKLNSLSAFFCFQIIILVLSLEHVPPWVRDPAPPTAACAGGAWEGSLPTRKGAGLMQTRTGCY